MKFSLTLSTNESSAIESEGVVALNVADTSNISIASAYTTPDSVGKVLLLNDKGIALSTTAGIIVFGSLP